MKLKRLEIYGFKSFADKTQIVFNDGITGIVGPNGSGKSNIGDAVRWVLGEQNARTLRGNRMEDVIFGGTALRKKSNYCEVSLIFDNEDHDLKSEYSEVMVTRRVYRSGDSEYYINKTACRLKDVLDMFRDTGIGREGYSLIGQGRIDEILSAKSDDRRAVFEEAAGVMTYRYRKEDAERKLQRTSDNLSRVNDILSELESRIEPLSKQAETARVYLEISGRLKELEIHIFVLRYDRSKARLDTIQATLDGLKEALEQHEKAISDNQALRGSIGEKLQAVEEELSALREKHQAAQDAYHRKKEAHQALMIRAENDRAQLLKTGESISDMERQLERDRALSLETGESRKKQAALISDAEKRLEAAEGELKQALDLADEREKALDEHKTAILEAVNRLGDVRNQQTRQMAVHAQMTQRLDEINDRLEETRAQDTVLKEALKEAEDRETEEKALLDELNAAAREENEALTALADETRHLDDRCQHVRLDMETDKSRLKLLQDLSREMEGYSQAVKKALQYGRGDPDVHDVLARLIHVPKEYETAIDMVLGGALQNIVTEDENAAKRLIDYLRNNKLGRCTFLPITTVRPRLLTNEEKRLLSMPGCIGIASELISYDPRYRGIVENLLGRTVIATDLQSGIAVMRAGRHAFRLVTLAGDVMHSGGSMTGGTAARTASLLSRERQIEETGQAVRRGEETLARLTKELENAREDLDRKQNAFAETVERVHQEEIGLAREQEHVGKAREACEKNAAEEERLLSAVEQLRDGIAALEEDLKRVADMNDTVEVDREKMDEETVRLQTELSLARADAEEKRETVRKAQEEVSELRHALDMIARDESQRGEALKKLGNDIEKAKADLKAGQDALEALSAAAQEAGNAAEKAGADAEKAAGDVDEAEKRRREHYEHQQEVLRQGDDLRSAYDQDTQRYHRQEMNLARAQNDLNNLCDHMFNTYEMTYAAAREHTGEDFTFDLPAGEKEAAELRNRIREMGPVNVNAVEEYASVKERFDALNTQKEDLTQAQEDLRDLISRLLRQMEGTFVKEFDKLNGYFAITFNRLFGGGQAELKLTDPNDPLNCGIEIVAQPPGKKLQMLSLLSGGERALTAIAILFAMLNLKPTPFCILDEIEAALDEANIGYFADYLAEYKSGTQFVVVTHRKGTMERCDALYGVAMQEQGISKMVSVDLRDYE